MIVIVDYRFKDEWKENESTMCNKSALKVNNSHLPNTEYMYILASTSNIFISLLVCRFADLQIYEYMYMHMYTAKIFRSILDIASIN